MAIRGISTADRPRANEANIVKDKTACKVNSYIIAGLIFLSIGIIATSVSCGLLPFNFGSYVLSYEVFQPIIGVATSTIGIGAITLVKGFYDLKHKAIDCDPKDFGILGINNTNNNCWLNSLLQMLLNNTTIKTELKKNRTFRKFIEQYDEGLRNDKLPDSNAIRIFLSGICPAIKKNGEFQDLQEPLIYILNLLRQTNSDFKNSLITRHYFKYESGRVEKVDTQEPNSNLVNLPINDNNRRNTLQNLISNYFQSKQNTDANVYQTVEKTVEEKHLWGLWTSKKRVKEYVEVEKRKLKLEERKLQFAPNNLFISVLRYLSNPDVSVPATLILNKSHFVSNQAITYSLESFAVNLGEVHYISYVRKNGVWFLCNDSTVEPISEADALKAAKKAYVLSYKKLG